ncbi:MAG: hypothetical protein IJY71_06265 [Clostridia bacterium]|nr:hypothetical protein [Clostridia bacterium]
MSTFINILSDSTFAEKMDTQNALLRILARKEYMELHTWTDVQALVRTGLAKEVLSIGDQLICQKEGKNLAWDVVGFDSEALSNADGSPRHSMTLQLHNPLALLPFACSHALYFCASALPAGTYYFYLFGKNALSATDLLEGGENYYHFTLTKDVPAGGHLYLPWTVGRTVVNTPLSSYASAFATSPIETVSVYAGESGTLIPASKTTSAERIRYGYNLWRYSLIRTYLNSAAAKGSIFKGCPTAFEHYAAWNYDVNGFMYGLDGDFLSVLCPVKKVSRENKPFFGGAYTETEDFFFLPSEGEVFAEVEDAEGKSEGSPYPYSRLFSQNAQAADGEDKGRIKYKDGVATPWLLRSVDVDTLSHCKAVGAKGELSGIAANVAAGIAPLCVIA